MVGQEGGELLSDLCVDGGGGGEDGLDLRVSLLHGGEFFGASVAFELDHQVLDFGHAVFEVALHLGQDFFADSGAFFGIFGVFAVGGLQVELIIPHRSVIFVVPNHRQPDASKQLALLFGIQGSESSANYSGERHSFLGIFDGKKHCPPRQVGHQEKSGEVAVV